MLATFLFTFYSGNIPFTDGDTAFYGQVAKNMIQHGDWVTLRFDHFDKSYLVDKPPLTMWIMAGLFKQLGINEFAGRIWHSLLASLIVWLTYLLGLRLFNHKVGILAGLILTTTVQFFYQAREPMQDIPLTFCFILAFYLYIRFSQTNLARYLYGISIALACAVLVKGPVGIVLPLIIIVLHQIFLQPSVGARRAVPLHLHFLLAIALFLCISLPWHIAAYLEIGPRFLGFFFGERTVGRYLSGGGFLGSALPTYLGYLLLGTLPWTIFLWPAIIKAWQRRSSFLLIWVSVIFLFFAISPGRTFLRYLLPLIPAVALLIAKYLDEQNYQFSKWSKGVTGLSGLLCLLVVLLANSWPEKILNPLTFQHDLIYIKIFSPFLLLFGLGLISTYLFSTRNQRLAISSLIIITSLSYALLILGLKQDIEKVLPEKQIGTYINTTYPNTPVARYLPNGGFLSMISFYTNAYVMPVTTEAELQNFLQNNPTGLVVLDKQDHLPNSLKSQLSICRQFGSWVVVKE